MKNLAGKQKQQQQPQQQQQQQLFQQTPLRKVATHKNKKWLFFTWFIFFDEIHTKDDKEFQQEIITLEKNGNVSILRLYFLQFLFFSKLNNMEVLASYEIELYTRNSIKQKLERFKS